MGEIARKDIVMVDLDKPLQRSRYVLSEGDDRATVFGAVLHRNGTAVDLTGATVKGFFIRGDGVTEEIDGTASGNMASVTLTARCYVKGNFTLSVKVLMGGVTHTVRRVDGYVCQTETDVVDGDVAISLTEAVERAEAAADRAEEAANNAGSSGGGGSATVTAYSIKTALGYTPADKTVTDTLTTKVSALETKVDNLGSGGTASSVPSYVTEEAERVAEAINGVRTAKSLVLLCASDIHTLMSYTPNVTATLHLAQGMNEICKRVTVDGVVNLGDTVWGASTSTIQDCKDEYDHLRHNLGNTQGVPQIWMQGNHDNNAYSGDPLTADQLYAYIGTNTTDKAVTDYDNLHRLYGYVDYERQKIRVIYLNTADSTDSPSTDYTVSTAQVQWLVDTLAAVPGGWGVVAMSHHPLNTSGGANTVILTILDAYKGKQSGSANGVSYNFASAQGEMICHLHGHIHNYQAQTFGTNGVLSITIPNGCFGRNNEYGTGGNTAWGDTDLSGNQRVFAKTSGTAEDTAYTAVVIDRANGVVHALRCGAGIDRTLAYNSDVEMFSVTMLLNNVSSSNGSTRVVSGMPYTTTLTANTGYALDTVEVYMGSTDITATAYANGKITIAEVTGAIIFRATAVSSGGSGGGDTTVNYNNLVKTSIATDGTIYNSTGYKEGYRLNSSGAETATDGCVTSGFIPYNGEVIRVWGATEENVGATGNYIGLYDSGFAKLYVLGGTGAVDYGATWGAVDGKYMLTVDPDTLTNETIKDHFAPAKYIRASIANGTGDAFAVTLDEEIS